MKPLTRKDTQTTISSPQTVKNSRTGKTQQRQPKSVTKESAPFFQAIVGTVIRDELHLERNEGAKTITVLKTIRDLAAAAAMDPPGLICMSGTPLTSGPLDLSYYVKAMVRPEWKRHPVLRNWMADEATQLGKKWDALCRSGQVSAQDSQECVAQFRPLVEELMVRFTTESNFLGTGPVVTIPQNVLANVECQLRGQWQLRLAQQKIEEDQRIREREQKRQDRYRHQHHGDMSGYQAAQHNRPSSYYRARLCASFPFLMDLRDKDGHPLKLTEQEWLERTRGGPAAEWVRETESDPYFAARKQIFNSSAKLTEIGCIWDKFRHTRDAEGELARLIFCSYFFTGSYILYLVSYQLVPGQVKANSQLAVLHL
jgi:hypothetical protein